MKKTDNLELNLPDDDDFFDVEHQNANMRKLDEKIEDVTKHLSDKVCHISPAERKKWNASAEKQSGGYVVSNTAPEDTNLLWVDSSGSVPVLKYYSESEEKWKELVATWG